MRISVRYFTTVPTIIMVPAQKEKISIPLNGWRKKEASMSILLHAGYAWRPIVGGKFDKNNEVFSTEWDFLIVDEATKEHVQNWERLLLRS